MWRSFARRSPPEAFLGFGCADSEWPLPVSPPEWVDGGPNLLQPPRSPREWSCAVLPIAEPAPEPPACESGLFCPPLFVLPDPMRRAPSLDVCCTLPDFTVPLLRPVLG